MAIAPFISYSFLTTLLFCSAFIFCFCFLVSSTFLFEVRPCRPPSEQTTSSRPQGPFPWLGKVREKSAGDEVDEQSLIPRNRIGGLRYLNRVEHLKLSNRETLDKSILFFIVKPVFPHPFINNSMVITVSYQQARILNKDLIRFMSSPKRNKRKALLTCR